MMSVGCKIRPCGSFTCFLIAFLFMRPFYVLSAEKENYVGTVKASFNCDGKLEDVERMICEDDSVSALDFDMSVLYKEVYSKSDDKDGLKEDQLEWLRLRNGCVVKSCIKNKYLIRINELSRRLADGGSEGGSSSPEDFVPIKSRMELIKRRGAESFALIESVRDKDVCLKILESVNKFRDNKFFENQEKLRKGIGGKINLDLPEMIIQTDLNAPRILVDNISKGSIRVEEFSLDADKDGVDEFVYRTTGYLSGVWVHQLFFLPVSYDDKKYVSFGMFIKDQRELGYVSGLLFQWESFKGLKSGDYLREIGSQIIYEIIEFNENYYILSTSSVVKEDSPINVAVLRLDKSIKIYPACFLGTNFFVAK